MNLQKFLPACITSSAFFSPRLPQLTCTHFVGGGGYCMSHLSFTWAFDQCIYCLIITCSATRCWIVQRQKRCLKAGAIGWVVSLSNDRYLWARILVLQCPRRDQAMIYHFSLFTFYLLKASCISCIILAICKDMLVLYLLFFYDPHTLNSLNTLKLTANSIYSSYLFKCHILALNSPNCICSKELTQTTVVFIDLKLVLKPISSLEKYSINQIQDNIGMLLTRTILVLQWILDHCGIPGNENVDDLTSLRNIFHSFHPKALQIYFKINLWRWAVENKMKIANHNKTA